MKLLKWAYEKRTGRKAPYYYSFSILTIIGKPIRKFVAQVLAPNCPFNNLRVLLYRICGFKIGRNVFIGMKCYLDDTCYSKMLIGNNVTISYGVYFAAHSKDQGAFPIVIEDNVYIGMRASVISKTKNCNVEGICIHHDSVVGACALVNCDVPAYSTAVGIPCRIIPKRCKDT